MTNAITTSKIHETDLTAVDEDKIAALIRATYVNVDFAGRTYFQQRHHFRMVAHDGEKLVAHMAALFRTVRLGNDLLDIIGIAEVATAVSHRKRGIASSLLLEVIASAKTSRASFVVLFGTESLYRKAGFQRCTNPICYVDLKGCETGEVACSNEHALMVLQLGERIWDQDAKFDLLGHIF